MANPGDAANQSKFRESRAALFARLNESVTKDFSPGWRQALEEMGLVNVFGEGLRLRMDEILAQGGINASAELTRLVEHVQTVDQQLGALISAMQLFNIAREPVPFGTCGLGLLVPRRSVDNTLGKLGEEFKDLDQIFGVFSEIALGVRPPLKIRTISSSDLSAFVEISAQTGALIATAIGGLLVLYKQILEIKLAKQKLVDKGVPPVALAGIDEHAKSIAEPAIDSLVVEILSTSTAEEGRKHELSTQLRMNLKRLANRIDRGLNVEIRVSEVTPDLDQSPKVEEVRHLNAQIRTTMANISFAREQSAPVLYFPEKRDEGHEPQRGD